MNFEYNDEWQLIHPNEQNKFMQHSDRLGALIRRCAENALPHVLGVGKATARAVYSNLPENVWRTERCQVATVYLPTSETWVCKAVWE
jgi:hypothetical protein